MTFSLKDLQLYFTHNEYYITQTCKILQITREELKNNIEDYVLSHTKLWIQAIRSIIDLDDFSNICLQIDKQKVNEYFKSIDNKMSFDYYLTFYISTHNYTLENLLRLAKSRRINKTKNICMISKYIYNDEYIDVLYNTLKVKKHNRNIDKKVLKEVILKYLPTNELQLNNALMDYNIELQLNLKNISCSMDFAVYLNKRIHRSLDYEYDLQTLHLIHKYILLSYKDNEYTKKAYIKILPYMFCHLVLHKYNSKEMINMMHKIYMLLSLLDESITHTICKTISNKYNKKIYKMNALEEEILIHYKCTELEYAYLYIVKYDDSIKLVLSSKMKYFLPSIKVQYINDGKALDEDYNTSTNEQNNTISVSHFVKLDEDKFKKYYLNNLDRFLITEVNIDENS